MSVTRLDAAWPELVLPPGATITVELDDPLAKVTKLNVYGFTPASDDTEPVKPYKPPYVYGAAQ